MTSAELEKKAVALMFEVCGKMTEPDATDIVEATYRYVANCISCKPENSYEDLGIAALARNVYTAGWEDSKRL